MDYTEIEFYKTETGNNPVEEYLSTLSLKQAEKVYWVLKIIEEIEMIPAEYFKKLPGTDNIYEVRVQLGNNIFRILGFFDGHHLIILNHAFTKKTQKTPKKEIKLAEKRKQEYFERRDR